MLKSILTILSIAFGQILPLVFTAPKFGVLFQLAYDAVQFIQTTSASTATSAEKREQAFVRLKDSAYSAGITASDHLLNKALELAVGKLKAGK